MAAGRGGGGFFNMAAIQTIKTVIEKMKQN